jgi:two-component system response regulator NreC
MDMTTPLPVRIVIVDDHAGVREGLKRSVAAEPDMHVVGEAADGQEAFRCIGALTPSIVLMDVSMPGWSGVLTTRKVTEAYADVKVIAISRHQDAAMVGALIDAGARGYVLKQSTSKDLTDAIRVVAAGGTYIDRGIRPAGPLQTDVEISAEQHGEFVIPVSPDEEQVLRLVARSHTTEEIGNLLSLSAAEVVTLRAEGMRKAKLTSRVQVMAYARMRGWMDER